MELAYGHTVQQVSLPAEHTIVLTERVNKRPRACAAELLQQALDHPMDSRPLHERSLAGKRVAILVSDVTRPCPTARMMPPLIAELERSGVEDHAVRIVVSLGSHRPQTPEELQAIVGASIQKRFVCENVPPNQFVEIGYTSRGTPVRAYRQVVDADLRVYVGNVEYHYFAGYSGGAKAFLPGVCAPETLTANHRMMIDPRAVAGTLRGNPVREDIEEAEGLVGSSFLYNVVLDGNKDIDLAVAGDVTSAHRCACARVDELYRVPITRPADLVVASAGGWPKDINLYQTNKTVQNAAHAVRDGGIIVVVSACRDGMGSSTFGEWLTSDASPDELLARLASGFVIGGHVAVALNKVLKRGVRVFLVSELDPTLVRRAKLEPFATAQDAVDRALDELGQPTNVVVMPHAGSTLPVAPNQ